MGTAIIIGLNIKRARELKEIKLETLAKHIGVTKGRMSQIEHGQCEEITIKKISNIADFLETDFLNLVTPPLFY